ncbi:hypothetical protein E2C01_063245 [Portunus trituberculatus]|uniref:Uncharacterized protein n=1 Tax=Portunus trituberculatus TaxID=210409 RepID=A0A5B7HD64_PORTR|nr:hypothetical protein [Portunus trituberculatus]
MLEVRRRQQVPVKCREEEEEEEAEEEEAGCEEGFSLLLSGSASCCMAAEFSPVGIQADWDLTGPFFLSPFYCPRPATPYRNDTLPNVRIQR